MLIMEGLLPFFSPSAWRNVFERMLQMNNGQLRFMGLCSMLTGLVALYFLLS
jgi:uncharacterized protein